MLLKKGDFCRWMIVFSIIWIFPSNTTAEFYKYVDKDGQTFYVDDLSKVPPQYLDQVNVYKEKYDHLPEDQRKEQLEQEHRQQEELEAEHLRQIELELQQTAEKEEAERKRREKLARQKAAETQVIINGNRVFVPVTLGNNGVEAQAMLLLDTGASQTVIHRSLAEQLNVIALKKGFSQVASGQQIYTELGKISYLKFGPHQIDNAEVMIINYEGPADTYQGLLGMNLLRNFQYNIDFKRQVIQWQPGK